MRAGVPTLVLWVAAEQPLWGKQVERLGVGTYRRFSATTRDLLVADLRSVLAPETAPTTSTTLAPGATLIVPVVT